MGKLNNKKHSRYIQVSDGIILEYIYSTDNIPDTSNDCTYDQGVDEFGGTFGNVDYLVYKHKYNDGSDNPSIVTDKFFAIDTRDINSNLHKCYLNDIYTEPYSITNRNTNIEPTGYAIPRTNLRDLFDDCGYEDWVVDYNDNYTIKFDTVKVYFTSHHDFHGYDALIFDFFIRGSRYEMLHTASKIVSKSEHIKHLAEPELIGERLYTDYIQFRLPSANWLAEDSNCEEIFDVACYNNTYIGFTMYGGILKNCTETKDNEYYYNQSRVKRTFNTNIITQTTFSNTDVFSDVNAYIYDATINGNSNADFGDDGGDFYIFGIETHTHNSVAEYFNSLPNNNYSLIHKIEVWETYQDRYGEQHQDLTDTHTIVQSSVDNADNYDYTAFDKPNKFRPVLRNAENDVAITLKYFLFILNGNDNTRVLKTAVCTDSVNFKKYGENLIKLNISNPTKHKIYNKVVTNKVDLTGNGLTINTIDKNADDFVPSAIEYQLKEIADVSHVMIGVSDSAGVVANRDLKYQGDYCLSISPFDNVVALYFYNEINEDTRSAVPMDLLYNVDIKYSLDFVADDNTPIVTIDNYVDENSALPTLQDGCLLFKISQEDSAKLLSQTNDVFYVNYYSDVNGIKSDKLTIFSGRYMVYSEAKKVSLTNDLVNANDKIVDLTNKLNNALYDKDDYKHKYESMKQLYEQLLSETHPSIVKDDTVSQETPTEKTNTVASIEDMAAQNQVMY